MKVSLLMCVAEGVAKPAFIISYPWEPGPGTWSPGPQSQAPGRGPQALGPGPQAPCPGTQAQGPGPWGLYQQKLKPENGYRATRGG